MPPAGDIPLYQLHIYSAGRCAEMRVIAADLRVLIQRQTGASVSVEVIDILQFPERAVADGVFTTPMLIKVQPPPLMRVVGELTNPTRVLGLLGIP